jgi:hypothetical protein
MSLLDEAVSLQQKPGSPCKLYHLRTEDPKLYAEILDALASTVHASAISTALKKRGVEIKADALSRHRRNDCERCRS